MDKEKNKDYEVKKSFTERISKNVFAVFTIVCLIAIVACFIIDFIPDRKISWSFYTLIAIPFLWGGLAPAFFAKKINQKVLFSLISFSVLVFPLLFALQYITPTKDWFMPYGLPVAVIGVVAVWISIFLIRKLKDNPWLLIACLMLVYGVIVNLGVNLVAVQYDYKKLINFTFIFNFASGIVITILLFFISFLRKKGKAQEMEIEKARLAEEEMKIKMKEKEIEMEKAELLRIKEEETKKSEEKTGDIIDKE